MKLSMNLYDALTSISVPPNKAKAVVNAWESDMEKFATKSDLLRTETQLQTSITELGAEVRSLGTELRALINEQGAELRASIKEQGAELRESMTKQGTELRESMTKQGTELREAMTKQGAELREAMTKQGAELRSAITEQGAKFQVSVAEMDSQNKILRWQLGILLVCITIPLLKLAYDMLIKFTLNLVTSAARRLAEGTRAASGARDRHPAADARAWQP